MNLTLIPLLLFLSVTSVQTQSEITRIDEYLNDWNTVGRFHGVVLIAHKDEVIFKNGYGYANREWEVPCTPQMKFDIGSISKQFTAVMIFQLIEEGKLELNVKLTDYLDNYRKETGDKITIDHLLQQTSGIPCYVREWTYTESENEKEIPGPLRHHFRSDFLISQYMSNDLHFDPGSNYMYSSSNHYLLGKIIENVTSKSYEQNLKERILLPLGLINTGFGDNEKIITNLSSGYVNVPTEDAKAPYFYYPNFLGTGGMYSTVEDLYHWNRALETNKLLPGSLNEKLFTPYWRRNEVHSYLFNHYSIQLSIGNQRVSYTSFSGAFDGFVTDVFRFPETGHIIVIHDNSAQNNQWEIVPGIYEILNNEPVNKPLRLASKYISNLALKKGIEEAVKELNNIKKNRGDEYDLKAFEYEVNAYSTKYKKLQRMDYAEALLELNTKLFPYSPDAWDSYGSILEATGKDSLSYLTFAKALEVKNTIDLIITLINDRKFSEVEEIFKTIRKTSPSVQILPSSRIGPSFGKVYSSDLYDDALEICRLWIIANPNVAGPYFSKARVYMKLGNIKETVACYRDIIELFPGSSSDLAKKELEKLSNEEKN